MLRVSTKARQRRDRMERFDLLAAALVIVGGLTGGLVAGAGFALVGWFFGLDFGETNAATRIVYGLVGLSAVYAATRLPALAQKRRRRTPRAVAHKTGQKRGEAK